jgi:outer membrane lipoprotein-sorting protein
MKPWKLAVVAAACLTVRLLPAQEGTEAEKLFRQMEAKLSKAQTLECTFATRLDPKGTFKGSLTFAEGNKARVEVTGEVDRAAKYTVVSDGTKIVRLVDAGVPEQVNEIKPQALREEILRSFGLVGGFAVLEFSFAKDKVKVSGFKLGKKEKLDGREAQVVEYEMTLRKTTISTTLWLDAKTTLPVKRVVRVDKGGGDNYTATETYTKLTLDEKIDAKKFELPK